MQYAHLRRDPLRTPRRAKWRDIGLILVALLLAGCGEQTGPTHSVGILSFGDSRLPLVEAFEQEMNRLGHEEGKSVRYLVRSAGGSGELLPRLVQELLSLDVDLIVSAGGLETDALQRIVTERGGPPVVALYVNAIVDRGTVRSRFDPGWEVTGVDNLNAELSGKRLALLHDLLPAAKRVLVLFDPGIAPARIGLESARRAAAGLGVEIVARPVTSRQAIRTAIGTLSPGEVDALLTVPAAPIDDALDDLVYPVTDRLRLPVFTHQHRLAATGGAASYGAPMDALGRQAARLADKVLAGTRAGSIPFEVPRAFSYRLNEAVCARLGIVPSELVRSQLDGRPGAAR